MLFPSLTFLFFFAVVFGIYWGLFAGKPRCRNVFLLGASYLFYGWWDWRFLGLIAASSALDFLVGKRLSACQTARTRKRLLLISLCSNFGLLGAFKYYDFFVESLSHSLSSIGISFDSLHLNWVLPVGISFYTFQTLSYTIDIYRRRIEPTNDPIAFFAFVAFFPQLVAGPIERAKHLLPQFERAKVEFSESQATDGLRMVLYGLFLKCVLAENLAHYVNAIFANPSNQSGSVLLLGAAYFGFQIYGDFAGYSLVARGIAALLGFDLMVNFRVPYFSRDIAEFWRRWHISLSTWFRDYLYIPLGGNRTGHWRGLRNVLIVFLVSGLWHGANWTFVAWGLAHGLAFAPLLFQKRHRKHEGPLSPDRFFPCARDILPMTTTFAFVSLTWVLFRAESLSHAASYYAHLLDPSLLSLPMQHRGGIIWIALVLLLDWVDRNNDTPLRLSWLWKPMRWSFYLALAALIYYRGYFGNNEFIYFQF